MFAKYVEGTTCCAYYLLAKKGFLLDFLLSAVTLVILILLSKILKIKNLFYKSEQFFFCLFLNIC